MPIFPFSEKYVFNMSQEVRGSWLENMRFFEECFPDNHLKCNENYTGTRLKEIVNSNKELLCP